MPRSTSAGSAGRAVGKGLGELAERIVDRRAAIGRRQRHVDGIERIEPQDIFRIDRVGIAQPVLDRGDRQFQRPRRARRLWRGLRDRLDLVGLVEFGGEADIVCRRRFRRAPSAPRRRRLRAGAGSARPPPARRRLLRNGSGSHRRCPSSCAKSCADRPMRRSGRSRPSSCRIGRLSQGSTRGAGGHTPSTSPPRMTRSDSVNRASSWP